MTTPRVKERGPDSGPFRRRVSVPSHLTVRLTKKTLRTTLFLDYDEPFYIPDRSLEKPFNHGLHRILELRVPHGLKFLGTTYNQDVFSLKTFCLQFSNQGSQSSRILLTIIDNIRHHTSTVFH